jgi:hypothetical protein
MLLERGNGFMCHHCDNVDEFVDDKEEGHECYASDCECREENDELIGECSFCRRSVCEDHSFMLLERGNGFMCHHCGNVDEFVDDKEDGHVCYASDCECREEDDELIGECPYCRRSVCEKHAHMLDEVGLYCDRDHCRDLYNEEQQRIVPFSDERDDNNDDDDDDEFLKGVGIATLSLDIDQDGTASSASETEGNDGQKKDDSKEDLKCKDCRKPFVLSDDERQRFRSRPLPTRCTEHRGKNKKKTPTGDALKSNSKSTGTEKSAQFTTPSKKNGAKKSATGKRTTSSQKGERTTSTQKKRNSPMRVFCYGGKGCGNEIKYSFAAPLPPRCSTFKGSHLCNWSHILCANCRCVIPERHLADTLREWVCPMNGCGLHGGIMTHYNLILH